MDCCHKLLGCSEFADALDELAIVGLRIEQDSVNNIAVVIPDGDEGNGIVSTPVGHGQGEITLFVFGVGQSTKKTSDFGVEVVLNVPSSARVDGTLETLCFGVFCDGILLYQGVRSCSLSWMSGTIHTIHASAGDGTIRDLGGRRSATINQDLGSGFEGSIHDLSTMVTFCDATGLVKCLLNKLEMS